MKTVGVYIFSDMVKQRTAKKRDTFFDGQNFIGLRFIVSEIDKTKYKIIYVSNETIDLADFVLVSLISYYDVINLINELYGVKHKCKIIAGGQGCANIELLKDIIDYAVIGRGEGVVPELLSGNVPDGVWDRGTNYSLEQPITIRPLQKYIEIEDPILGYYRELSIGCSRKCYFCEYSWKNKYCNKAKGYSSGVADRETRIEEVTWANYKNKDLVTAVDGQTEATRKKINKEIKDSSISNKIAEIYDSGKDYLSLKLYCLLGFPFETTFEPETLLEALTCNSGKGDTRLNIVIISPHFMPMPFTPMECEPANNKNYRDIVGQYDFGKWQKSNIKVFWPQMTTSAPANAFEATILHRGHASDAGIIKAVLCSSKYKSLPSALKVEAIKKYFPGMTGEVKEVLPYINRTNPTNKAKELYYGL